MESKQNAKDFFTSIKKSLKPNKKSIKIGLCMGGILGVVPMVSNLLGGAIAFTAAEILPLVLSTVIITYMSSVIVRSLQLNAEDKKMEQLETEEVSKIQLETEKLLDKDKTNTNDIVTKKNVNKIEIKTNQPDEDRQA